jgi:hypothetical protein
VVRESGQGMGGEGARVAETGRPRQANPDGISSLLEENYSLNIRTQWPRVFVCVCKTERETETATETETETETERSKPR